jgi:hypothetical protein
VTISNGSTILEADLSGLITSQLTALQADNAGLPLGLYYNFTFQNLVTGTPATRRKAIVVIPHDMYLEVAAVQGSDFTAASTLTVDLTAIDEYSEQLEERNPLVNWPVRRTGTVGAGINKLSRLHYDNTKTKAGRNFNTTSRAFRSLLKGSTWKLSLETTSVATPSMCHVMLVARQHWARE